jgi:hypothetical protein
MDESKKNPFVYQKANEDQSAKIKECMAYAGGFHEFLLTLPPSRETSLAITKLEEVAMWANKSIAFNS